MEDRIKEIHEGCLERENKIKGYLKKYQEKFYQKLPSYGDIRKSSEKYYMVHNTIINDVSDVTSSLTNIDILLTKVNNIVSDMKKMADNKDIKREFTHHAAVLKRYKHNFIMIREDGTNKIKLLQAMLYNPAGIIFD